MALPALLVGVGVVGAMWALSGTKQPSPAVGASTGATAPPSSAVASPSSGDDPGVEMDADPNGQQPASVQTTTTSPEGASTDTTASPSSPSSTADPSPPTYATAPGQSDPPPPPPAPTMVNYDAGYQDQYGSSSGKMTASTYYIAQAAAGNVIF
jgi:hypothetical protein